MNKQLYGKSIVTTPNGDVWILGYHPHDMALVVLHSNDAGEHLHEVGRFPNLSDEPSVLVHVSAGDSISLLVRNATGQKTSGLLNNFAPLRLYASLAWVRFNQR